MKLFPNPLNWKTGEGTNFNLIAMVKKPLRNEVILCECPFLAGC